MRGFIMIALLSLTVVVIGIAYVTAVVGRFGRLKQIENRRKRWLISFLSVMAGIVVCALLTSVTNAIVIFLHLLAFCVIIGVILRIVQSVRKETFSVNWQGWLAFAVTILYMSAACYLCMNVWQTDYTLQSKKITEPVRIALFADSHVGTTFDGDGFAGYMKTIEKQKPDIVLIAGDYVDDSTSREDMEKACAALGKLKTTYGVWYAFGNHDKGYADFRSFTAEELERELLKNKVHIMQDSLAEAGELCIVGRADAMNRDRADIDDLLEKANRDKYIIVMDHEPTDYENEKDCDADLIVSGHTHGGQLFPFGYIGEWLGLNDKTYGYERINDVEFLVTSGISNWELYFKTGTKSEYVIIDLKPE